MSDGARVKKVEPRLLRRQQAARYLDISGSAFDGLVKTGVFAAAKAAALISGLGPRRLNRRILAFTCNATIFVIVLR